MTTVSISIDDGHPLDLKLAEVLEKNKINATFYIPAKKSASQIMTKSQIRQLALKFNIGSHTYNHVDLTKIGPNEALKELVDGKKALEDIVGKKIRSFAFPFGHYSQELVPLVKKAGFDNCRSGRIVNFNEYDEKSFLRHPNLQIYPHKLTTDLRHCLKYGDMKTFWKRLILASKNHLDLFGHFSLEKPLHFWCHSQDIENFDLWGIFNHLKSVGG